jgi:molecular chaperone GrpE
VPRVSSPDEKGKFSTDIGQDVIEEALRSVKKHTGAAEEIPVEVEGQPSEEAAAPGSEHDKELASLKAQLDFSMAKGRELMERIKEGHEKMLRAIADLENYKKRAAKEKDEIQRFGSEKLLKDLLPVVDNLDRAMEHSKAAADYESFKQGVAMTRKLFEDTIGRHGVKAFTSVGKAFDPRFHEAMQQVETGEVPPNQVVSEVLRGFTLNERLVRPALVMVSKAPTVESQAPGAPTGVSGPGDAPEGT